MAIVRYGQGKRIQTISQKSKNIQVLAYPKKGHSEIQGIDKDISKFGQIKGAEKGKNIVKVNAIEIIMYGKGYYNVCT